ncbi:hypothetical protein AMJ47_02710 [Parcubacteria bacterium DG_72]|nr:MAG: hypothetical protein AMJ47_02710 [Parcubacteria bacterium DG_72]
MEEKIKKKVIAQKLRRNGYSISEIAEKLNIQKSGSISKWCQDICLTQGQINRLAEKQKSGSYKGRMNFLERLRRERIKEISELKKKGIKDVGELKKRDFFIGGIAMYWGEGYKYSGGNQVGFTNSDPKMILFMLKWFKDICGVSDDRITLQVKINEAHKDRVGDVEDYWSRITKVSRDQFNKTVLIKTKSKKDYSNFNEHFGTLRITIKNGTQIRRKIMGWIDGLKNNIS